MAVPLLDPRGTMWHVNIRALRDAVLNRRYSGVQHVPSTARINVAVVLEDECTSCRILSRDPYLQ